MRVRPRDAAKQSQSVETPLYKFHHVHARDENRHKIWSRSHGSPQESSW